MTQEEKMQQTECLCKSKGFRKFVITATGTFVGVYCALALFCAINKPPMILPPPIPQPPAYEQYAPCPCAFHKYHKMFKQGFDKLNDIQKPPIQKDIDKE